MQMFIILQTNLKKLNTKIISLCGSSSGGTVVEHSPHLLKVKGLSQTTAAVFGEKKNREPVS
jgi:hypothetical protein